MPTSSNAGSLKQSPDLFAGIQHPKFIKNIVPKPKPAPVQRSADNLVDAPVPEKPSWSDQMQDLAINDAAPKPTLLDFQRDQEKALQQHKQPKHAGHYSGRKVTKNVNGKRSYAAPTSSSTSNTTYRGTHDAAKRQRHT